MVLMYSSVVLVLFKKIDMYIKNFFQTKILIAFCSSIFLQCSNKVIPVLGNRQVIKPNSVKYYDNAKLQKWVNNDTITNGWDLSFPPGVKPSENGFLACIIGPSDDTFPGNKAGKINISWKELEPQEGKHQFNIIREKVRQLADAGYKAAEMHIRAAVWETRYWKWEGNKMIEDRTKEGSAPRWLKGKVPLIEEDKVTNLETPFQVVNMDTYYPAYHQSYLKFINALGESGVLELPELRFIYLHEKSGTRGEEGGGPAKGDKNYPVYEERLEAWAEATKDKAKHVMYTGWKGDNLDLAYEKGFGQRNGFVEMYLLHTDNPQLGQSIDKNGYLICDDDFPPIKEGRSWGDENEEYKPSWIKRFGSLETFHHRYRESSLRALQMRRNILWEQGGGKTLDPHITAFVGMELGHTIETTPDIWCYLRESYVHKGEKENNPVTPVKNFERWLFQRDKEEIQTVPTRKVEHGTKGVLPERLFRTYVREKQFDYTARKGKRIGFSIDERFLTAQSYVLKITYYDNADFKVHFNTQSGIKKRTVSTTNTDKIKTATFYVDELSKNENGSFDVEITSKDEAEVSFVRIIRI